MTKIPFSVVIPAAGFSGRMGMPKAELLTREGDTFLNHLLGSYLSLGAEQIILVSASNLATSFGENERLTQLINPHPEKGRSHSLKLGFQKVNQGNACFIQNIDNPFWDESLIAEMIDKLSENASVVPCFEDQKGHPVLLGKTIVQYLKSLESIDNLKVELDKFPRQLIQWNDPGILLNINTPEQYSLYRQL